MNSNALNPDVTSLLGQIKHPLKKEIDYLRLILLRAHDGLLENIKWNGPNYHINGQDRISIRVHAKDSIQIIFHLGAKAKDQSSSHLIAEDFGLLEWKANDRAILSFRNMAEIKAEEAHIQEITRQWLQAST